jgi:hypothetical protein
MTMNFKTVRDALISTLETGAAGQYRVLGYQDLAQNATSVTGSNHLVQVSLSEAHFPKERSCIGSVLDHDLIFRLILTVSEMASGDLAVIENLSSTPAELATALANIKNSEDLADKAADDLYEAVCEVLYNATEIDLGLSEELESKWLDNYKKSKPTYLGSLVVVVGTVEFTCATPETFDGEASISGNIVDMENEANTVIGAEDDVADSGKVGVLTGD